VDAQEDLARVPEALLATFGELSVVLTLALHPERKLARADVNKVIESVEKQGYYIQAPPSEGEPEASLFPALREHMERSE
jgi:uncharacterized protein YcgL (UPF0745 family)